MRRAAFSFRRARRVPPKKPTAEHRSRVVRALARVRRLVALGRAELFFGDEAGFCLLPSIPSLWQPKGQTLGLPAQAHGKRLNVVGFLRERDGALFSFSEVGRLGAAEFIAAVEEKLLPAVQPTRPAVLVLDNSALHRAKIVQARRAEWKKRGLRLLFLPPYSPHLNRIETLWRLVKYRWLPAGAYACFQTLTEEVRTILDGVGTHYHVTFS